MESRPRMRRAQMEEPGGPALGERGDDGVGGAPGEFRPDLVLDGVDDHPAPGVRPATGAPSSGGPSTPSGAPGSSTPNRPVSSSPSRRGPPPAAETAAPPERCRIAGFPITAAPEEPPGRGALRPRGAPAPLAPSARPSRPPGEAPPLTRSRDNPGVRVSKTLDPAGLPLRPAGDDRRAVTEQTGVWGGSSVAWDEAFGDLDEIARGIEVYGPIPGEKTLRASRSLLSRLAGHGLPAPLVDEVEGRGIAIEFPGAGERTRLSFVVETDGSVAYYELIDGHPDRQRFPEVAAAVSAVWPSCFRRAGLLPRPDRTTEPEPPGRP